MRRIVILLCLSLAIASGALLAMIAHDYDKRYQADQVEIGYAEYISLGRARMTDPVYRMASMIELQCETTTDFKINKDEEKQIAKLYAKLKKKPEHIEDPLMQICQEWKKHKATR